MRMLQVENGSTQLNMLNGQPIKFELTCEVVTVPIHPSSYNINSLLAIRYFHQHNFQDCPIISIKDWLCLV